jgi:hypothetical protein
MLSETPTKKEFTMRTTLIALVTTALVSSASAALADDAGSMSNMNMKPASSMTAAANYRIETVGSPQAAGPGKTRVSLHIVHAQDNKPASGAIIITTRADMGPEGMGDMTAPVKVVPSNTPDIYTLEVDYGSVWKKPGSWKISVSAKVQGEAQTVSGSVTVALGG